MELNWAPQNRWQTEEPDPAEAAPWTAQPPLAPTGGSAGPAGAPPQPAGGADSDVPGPEASNEHLPLNKAGPPQSEDEQEEPEGGYEEQLNGGHEEQLRGWHEEQFDGGHPRQGPRSHGCAGSTSGAGSASWWAWPSASPWPWRRWCPTWR